MKSVTHSPTPPSFFEQNIEEIKSINEEILYSKSRSSTLYSKMSEEPAKLEDFKTIRIVGQGSYGKVSLLTFTLLGLSRVSPISARQALCHENHPERPFDRPEKDPAGLH